MKEREGAKSYHQFKTRLFYAGLALDVFLLVLLWTSGFSLTLRQLAFEVFSPVVAARGVYIFLFFLVFYLVHFPISWGQGFLLEHRFRLSRQSFSSWLKDDLKKAALGGGFLILVVETAYLFLDRFPRTWWVGAGAFYVFLSLILARVMPLVIIPLFFKYTPIEDEALKRKIFSLFEKCRIPLKDIYAIDLSTKTKKANAFVCGLGRQRRVVLTDNLISQFSHEEIGAVVAHELGHYVHRDTIKLVIINGAMIFFAFFAAGQVLEVWLAWAGGFAMNDIATFPILALTMAVLGFVTTPALNAFSRYLEVNADRFSLEATQAPSVFISMMEKLGNLNLAEWSPGRFDEIMFYDHPPIFRRIAFAENFKKGGTRLEDS